MIYSRLLTCFFLIIFISNFSLAQGEEIQPDPKIEQNEESTLTDVEAVQKETPENEAAKNMSKVNFVKAQKMQRPSDKVFRKYMEMNKKDTRFDIDFVRVNQYDYSSNNKKDNLTIMQNQTPVYNRYSYYRPSFVESFFYSIALGILGQNNNSTSFF